MKFPFFAGVANRMQFANRFLEEEMVEDNLRELQAALLKQFFPDLLKQSETEIRQTAANVVSLLKELILHKIVTQYEELLFIDF